MGNQVIDILKKTGREGRTARLKKSIENLMDAGVRKTTFYPLIAESLAETVDQPQQIRRAKAFEHLLDRVDLAVLPHELLGGSILGMWPVDPDIPGYEEQYARAEQAVEEAIYSRNALRDGGSGVRYETQARKTNPGRFALMARDHYDANIDYTRLQTITSQLKQKYEGSGRISSQEIAQTLEIFFQYDYGKDVMGLIDDLPWISANHLHLDYGMIINTGYGKLLEKIETKLAETGDAEKREFYTAAQISVKAAIRYIQRYAAAFAEAAEKESGGARAAELALIGETMKKISLEKADSFREAMQLMWITHVIANTCLGSALSFARFDQYMFPFYDRDIQSGAVTHEEAVDLLCCMMLKVNEPKMRTVQSVILAGTTPDGRDAANELTRVFLEAARMVKLPYPNIAVRIAKDLSPEWLYDESIRTIREGFGMPMLVNDDVWVKNFTALGYPVEYAREYYNMGCVEMLIQNRHGTSWVSLPKRRVFYSQLLDELFDDYRKGAAAFTAFEEFFEACLEKLRLKIRGFKLPADFVFPTSAGCDPFCSMLVEGCLEKGRDMFRSGPELPRHVAIKGVGLATLVDSLSAIKNVVYDRKHITLEELIRATENNFRDNENLRQYILSTTAHYGNDDDIVDTMAAKIFDTFTAEVYNLNDGTIGEKYVSSYFGYTNSVSVGEVTGATPDGRLAGEPVSDGLGPSQGRDIEGPTKFFNTMLKLNYSHLNGSLATNIKINPSLFNTNGGILALKNLLKSYLFDGGPQVQINFVTQEDLIDAKINPQKHRDLVVRIAGFCEYFIYLDVNQQNEVIMRTEHSA
jgi:formate C-acetyltransferase